MFAVLYKFSPLPGKTDVFLEGWHGMTKLIRDHEGGLGSRLHRVSDTEYIAYAQWPDRETWENSGEKLPPEAGQFRKMMRESCEEILTMHTMDVVDDLLVK